MHVNIIARLPHRLGAAKTPWWRRRTESAGRKKYMTWVMHMRYKCY